jgi:deoxyadenosine/deoxycytidine kinase
MMNARYIAVEGPIGVGTTCLAQMLASRHKGTAVLEQPGKNPFLSDFYKDKERYAFQTQLSFLFNRYQQLLHLSQLELFEIITFADYVFGKDRIFANLNLDENEIALYNKIYAFLEARLVKPDLVIFIQASTDVLLKRIRMRGLEYEKPITEEYVDRVNQAYNCFFFHYVETPLLVINTSEIDFVNQPEDLDDLVGEIDRMGEGTRYYRPLGSRGK